MNGNQTENKSPRYDNTDKASTSYSRTPSVCRKLRCPSCPTSRCESIDFTNNKSNISPSKLYRENAINHFQPDQTTIPQRSVKSSDTEYSYNQIGTGVNDSVYLRQPTPKRDSSNPTTHMECREYTKPGCKEHSQTFSYPICQHGLLRDLTPYTSQQKPIINSGISTELRQSCRKTQEQGCQFESAFIPVTWIRPPKTTTPRTICQTINQIFTRELVHYKNLSNRYWCNYRRPYIPSSHRRNICII